MVYSHTDASMPQHSLWIWPNIIYNKSECTEWEYATERRINWRRDKFTVLTLMMLFTKIANGPKLFYRKLRQFFTGGINYETKHISIILNSPLGWTFRAAHIYIYCRKWTNEAEKKRRKRWKIQKFFFLSFIRFCYRNLFFQLHAVCVIERKIATHAGYYRHLICILYKKSSTST